MITVPFVTICAFLEESGYRRSEIGHLTRAYVKNVLRHTRDRDGRLIYPEQPGKLSHQRTRERLFRFKAPEWRIEREVNQELDRIRDRHLSQRGARRG